MTEIKITIEAPELVEAINNLASAMPGNITPINAKKAKTEKPNSNKENDDEDKVTMAQITEIAKQLVIKDRDGLKRVLKEFGLTRAGGAKPDQYEALYEAMKEIA